MANQTKISTTKMLSIYLHLQLLLAFAISLSQVHAQNPGFISLDCGLRDTTGYSNPTTGIYYTTDEAYIETGQGRSISPAFNINSIPPHYLNVRSFPGSRGSRNCYNLKPLYGKGNKILLRVGFLYGNYDSLSEVPEFDLYLGVNHWETVILANASSFYNTEIIHKLVSDYVDVCLVDTGKGTPFVSVIELRSMDPSRPVYNTTSGSLKYFRRWDLGSSSNHSSVRYKDDPYDRIWEPYNLANSTVLRTNERNLTQNWYMLPPIIMSTAAQGRAINDSLVIPFGPDYSLDNYYMYFHFAELVANQSREMNIYQYGFLHWYGPLVLHYPDVMNSIYSTRQTSGTDYTINATSNSTLPPILNALEVYSVKHFPHYETDENEVAAITSIKTSYAITRNWQGDPCSPKNLSWIGINCSYNGFEPPNIISLNLSSSRLIGNIAPSISNLKLLQSLDLSYNNLTGRVPDFLSQLPSLKYLYLGGNNFTGSLPSALLEKSRNGSLILSFEKASNTNSCLNDACKKKKNSTTIIPVVASIASFFAVLAFSTLLCIICRRKRKVLVESKGNNGSSIEPKLRQFTYSEVMSFIEEKKILGGGSGSVYLGCMNGVEVAVKVLTVSPEQETRDFQSEVKILETVHHKNLTRILGYCNEGVNKAIIFEFMENGNLNSHLSETNPNVLSWELRLSILIGAAEGLEYLHHGCKPPVIHRDIKPENILLTKDFEAKLADFGFSRIFPEQSSRLIGTPGYLDPQYKEPSMLTEKIDVFSFGVVMLVVITGQSAIIQASTHITQWVGPKIKNGDIKGIIDPRLEGNYDADISWRVIELAMDCVCSNSSSRPNMTYVVKELKNCFPAAEMPQDEPNFEGIYSNDAAGITLSPLKMTSLFKPSTR